MEPQRLKQLRMIAYKAFVSMRGWAQAQPKNASQVRSEVLTLVSRDHCPRDKVMDHGAHILAFDPETCLKLLDALPSNGWMEVGVAAVQRGSNGLELKVHHHWDYDDLKELPIKLKPGQSYRVLIQPV